MLQTGWYARDAGDVMGHIHYIYYDGTEKDRLENINQLSIFLGMGYVGFAVAPDGIMVYKPLKLGLYNVGNAEPKEGGYRLRCCNSVGES